MANALRSVDEGELGSRCHINLPGVNVGMLFITQQDRHDIELGIRLTGLLAKGDQVVIISNSLARDELIKAVQMRIVEQLGLIARKLRPACQKTWPTGCSLARREIYTLWNSTLRIGF